MLDRRVGCNWEGQGGSWFCSIIGDSNTGDINISGDIFQMSTLMSMSLVLLGFLVVLQ